METHWRTWVRAISWRLVAFILTLVIAFIVTDDIKETLEIGLLDSVLKLVAHYIHDRLWFKVKWGRHDSHSAVAPVIVDEGVPKEDPDRNKRSY